MANRDSAHRVASGIHVETLACVRGEWAEEFAEARQDDAGLTMQELAAVAGISRRAMNRAVREGLDQGRYIQGVATRTVAGGRQQRIPVYRVVKP